MGEFNLGELLQQLGVGLGLAVGVSWLFYKHLISRIKVLERIISRHDLREAIHIKFIGKLISLIPTSKKATLDKALKEYHDELAIVDRKKPRFDNDDG